mgnify:FL=1
MHDYIGYEIAGLPGEATIRGVVDKEALIKFLGNFPCTDVNLRFIGEGEAKVGDDGFLHVGGRKFKKFFYIPLGSGDFIAFTISEALIEAMIGHGIIKTFKTQ